MTNTSEQKSATRIALKTSLSLLVLSLNACSLLQKDNTVGEVPLTPLPTTEIRENKAFTEESLYALLVAELGLTRGNYTLGLESYADQARNSEDLNVTARATQIARILNNHELSLELSTLWKDLDPGNREARLILISELTHQKSFIQAIREAKDIIYAGDEAPIEEIAIKAAQAKSSELPALEQALSEIVKDHPNNQEALLGLSILQLAQNNIEQSTIHADRALAISPNDVRALFQKYRILSSTRHTDQAAATYVKIVEQQPNNFRTRSHYARLLLKVDRTEALKQYQQLLKMAPENHDIKLNIALLHQDLGQANEAKTRYENLIENNEHVDASHYWLGDIAETQEDSSLALQHYMKVQGGQRYIDAITKASSILANTESVDNALLFISSRRESSSGENKERLYVIEAETYARVGKHNHSNATYSNALNDFPKSIPILYSRAMYLASKLDIQEAEIDFRTILELEPDNTATLNALGYTLADSTNRHQEAKDIISKALTQRPDDAAILDSMGWVEFKLGNLKVAAGYLKRAFEQISDHEIGAHYGEILWSQGKKRQARRVWKKALATYPDSPILRSSMKRLGAN
ncbi:MAG: tetratricopeptide (TPR) repeat protein [Flavobacteriales bacterium]|jgi:tetratricopeptide (TPR) repeat protein